MKIEGPNKTSGTKGTSKTGAKKGAGDGAFGGMIDGTSETEAQAPVARTPSIGALDVLLALQGSEGSTSEEAAKRAKRRAGELLDYLDKIKIGLLTGELPQSTLRELAHSIATHRDSVVDPKLVEILDEIDLRAQVELAKLSR